MGTSISMPGGAGPDAGVISGGGDISGELGSLLGDAFDSAASEVDAPAEPGAEGLEAAEPVIDEPAVDPSAQATDPAQPQSPDSPYQLSPDGKFYHVPKQELPMLQTARQFHEAVSRFFPTPQDAQTSYLQASDLRTMSNDWLSGSDSAIQGVLQHWAGANHAQNPAMQQKYQQSFAKMAAAVPDALRQMNPQAYESMLGGIATRQIENAYDKAARTQNPEDFKHAQELDWVHTGQYKQELPKVDPRAQEMSQFERERQAFDQRQNAALMRDKGGFNDQALEGAKFKALGGDIEKLLGKIKDRYTPVAFSDITNGIQAEIVNAMKGMPTQAYPQGIPGQREWFQEHKQAWDQLMMDFEHTWRNGSPGQGLAARAQAFQQAYLSRAKQYLPSIAKPRIEAATRSATARAQNGQFAAQQGQQPRPGVQPQTNNPPAKGPQGRMPAEQWDREFAAAFR